MAQKPTYEELEKRVKELEQAEDALRESEERFRLIFDNSADAHVLYKEGQYIACNQSAIQMLGFREEGDLLSLNPADISPVYQPDGEVSRDKADSMIALAFEKGSHRFEWLCKRSDNSDLLLDVLLNAIRIGGEVLIHAVWRDITEQKQTEQALEESVKRFQTLVEKSPFGISLINKDGLYEYLNPRFEEMFGYAIEDIPTGKMWFHKAYPEEKYRREVIGTWKEDQRNMGTGEARPRTYEVVCKDGQKRVIHFRPVTMENGDQLVFHEDVTETTILERQLRQAQKVEALSTLTGGIAHDYNNLHAIIIGNLSLIMEQVEAGSELADFVNEVNKASLKASELTHELMSLSRGGAPIKKPGSVKELLRNGLKEMPLDADMSLEESISEDLWPVSHDPNKLGAVFRNVVKNAVEAMPHGGSLTLKARNLRVEDGRAVPGLSVKPGDYVRISIQDNGSGISVENLDKIFDPYFSTKAMGVQKGMGLGLATAHAIVKGHGGDITVQSARDVGTTVTIYLPAEPQRGKTGKTIENDLASQSPVQRILLMDDEEMLRNLAKQMLNRLGYEVETVKNGAEAIEAYKNHFNSDEPFDGVILDLTIKGGMGGEQTLQKLLKIDRDVKAIVSSGYFNDPVMADFQEYGFKGAMEKPYEMKDLKEALEKVIQP